MMEENVCFLHIDSEVIINSEVEYIHVKLDVQSGVLEYLFLFLDLVYWPLIIRTWISLNNSQK